MEINETKENYVGLFADKLFNPNRKEIKFYLMKDGATHASLYDLSYEDYLLLKESKIIESKLTSAYQEYAVYYVDVNAARNYFMDTYEKYIKKEGN